jgi:hypothetical protein
MGHKDIENSNPLDIFANSGEPNSWNNERLHHRLREGQGYSLFRVDQLDAIYDDLMDEPLIKLEYDRFLPDYQVRAD